MESRVSRSLMFICAVLLLGIASLIGFPIAAKQKIIKHRSTKVTRAFLADKKRTLAYYNVISLFYDFLNPFLYTSSIRDEVLKFIHCDKSLRVLDVGCGTGYTTWGILKLGNVYDTIGIDQNYIQLRKARRNLRLEKSRISLSRGDVENLPFRNETFDAVVSAGAVEYFPEPGKAIKEMYRVLKHRGNLIVAGPEFDWFKKLALHKIFYTPTAEELGRLFHRMNMQNIQTKLTGLDTIFGTDKYVLIVKGTK